MTKNSVNKNYDYLLDTLKQQITSSRYKASIKVNKELICLYYKIGRNILEAQDKHGWGAKVIDQLSKDLKSNFPEMKGFSPRSLKYMRKFAEEYTDYEFVQEVLAQLTWYHNITLMEKTSDLNDRYFYIQQAIEHGWSRNDMVTQINRGLHQRQGKIISNFKSNLMSPHADAAHHALKDPYIFDFLSISDKAHERDIEQGLIKHMEKFLLELGAGFSFVGRQYHLEVADQDFYLDLLFYHLKLRCFVVVELKDTPFKPEYAGKMNFYLSAVDDLIRHETDEPSIGLILCKTKNNILAEYTLRDMKKPIGLSEYQLSDALPKKLSTSLPSIEELEKELSKDETS